GHERGCRACGKKMKAAPPGGWFGLGSHGRGRSFARTPSLAVAGTAVEPVAHADPRAERRPRRAELFGPRERRVEGIPGTAKIIGTKNAEALISRAEEIVDAGEQLPIAVDLPGAIEGDHCIPGHRPVCVAIVFVAPRVL